MVARMKDMAKRKLDRMSGDASVAYGRLAGDVAREILLTIGRENRRRDGGFTKKELADLIGRDKGFVTRTLSGAHNLQLRTIAAMLGAMGYVMDVKARPVHAPEEYRANANPTRSIQNPESLTRSASPLNKPADGVYIQNAISA